MPTPKTLYSWPDDDRLREQPFRARRTGDVGGEHTRRGCDRRIAWCVIPARLERKGLLLDRHVITHRALAGAKLAGFIMSRLVEDEAEILSVAVARRQRGRGLARRLLNLNLRRLAGLGARAVFLEVDEHNDPALRLYHRAGFQEVSRRTNYYPGHDGGAAALVLRRDL